MKKSKTYAFTRFEPDVLAPVMRRIAEAAGDRSHTSLKVRVGDEETWVHDTFEEFFADYRGGGGARVMVGDVITWNLDVSVGMEYLKHGDDNHPGWETTVTITAPTRKDIESNFAVFEDAVQSSRRLPTVPPPETITQPKPRIFIGHGRSSLWRDLKDHLHEQHKYPVEAFETGARAGHVVRDILLEMMGASSFALLVMTAEDEQSDGTKHARQNVIHEAGLFQGRLGFSRAILLLEEGCEEFSNVQSVQQIRFARGRIKETYGDVLATLKREFPE